MQTHSPSYYDFAGRPSDAQLQKLIDGELSGNEYQHVLAACEQSDCWRDVAMLFLEAQSFGDAVADLFGGPKYAVANESQEASCQTGLPIEVQSKSASFTHTKATDKNVRRTQGVLPTKVTVSPWLATVTLAASFALAFALGLAWQKYGQPSSEDSQSPMLVNDEGADEVDNDHNQQVIVPPQENPWNSPKGSKVPLNTPAVARNGNTPDPLANLTLTGNDGSQPISVPVYRPDDFPQAASPTGLAHSPVAKEVVQQAEAAGLSLERAQGWMSVVTSDGNHVLLPVEQVRFVPPFAQ